MNKEKMIMIKKAMFLDVIQSFSKQGLLLLKLDVDGLWFKINEESFDEIANTKKIINAIISDYMKKLDNGELSNE